MARVKNQLLGKISGKVDDLIFKSTKSGGIVYKNKRIRKSSDSQAAKDNNNRFSVAVGFTNAIHDSILLKRTWKSFKNLKGNRAYDKIHSYVSIDCHSDFIGKVIRIIPHGLSCSVVGFKHDSNNVEFEIKPYDDFTSLYKDPCSIVAIIYLNTPVTKRKGRKVFPHNSFIMVEEDFDTLGLDGLNNVTVKFENFENEFTDIDNYLRVRVYISVFFNDANNKLNWTSSDSYLYKGHDIDNAYYDEQLVKNRQKREDASKPRPKFKRIAKI